MKNLLHLTAIMLLIFIVSCTKNDSNNDDNKSVKAPCDGVSTVYDADGNEYTVVTIGEQCWMAENLKTTKFNDGDAISNLAPEYDDSIAKYVSRSTAVLNPSVYYNTPAVYTGKLCPEGWHIASEEEWRELELFLGMNEEELNYVNGHTLDGIRGYEGRIGVKLQATTWVGGADDTIPASEYTGFNALQTGNLSSTGQNSNLYSEAHYWTSTGSFDGSELRPRMSYRLLKKFGGVINKESTSIGYKSCRCIRDRE